MWRALPEICSAATRRKFSTNMKIYLRALLPELRKTIRLALPIAIGLGGQGALFVCDTLMAGWWLGPVALAAAAFAGNLVMLPYVFGLGLAVSVPVLTAQGRGAGRPEDGAAALRHGLLIAGAWGVAIGLAIQLGVGLLDHMGQDPEILPDAKRFAVLMGWSILPGLLFQCLKNHREATGHPWISLLWLSIGIVVNIVLNWVLIQGKWGAPEMGLAGAGLATVLARVVMLVGLAWHPGGQSPEWRNGLQVFWLKASLGLGFPSALQWTFEAGVFALAPVLIGLFGKEQQAAHQVAISLASLAFMIPLGISQGASIRVGEAFGARNRGAMEKISVGALLFGTGFMLLYATTVVGLRDRIPWFFLDQAGGADILQTVHYASQYIMVAAVFALGDGLQVVASGALRGMSDVRFTSVAAFVCYWLVSMPAGLALAYWGGQEGLGIWMGMAVGIFAAAVVLNGRLAWKLRRRPFLIL